MCNSKNAEPQQQKAEIIEESTGIHIVEIHIQSVGVGILLFVFIIALGFLLKKLWTRYNRRQNTEQIPQRTWPQQAWPLQAWPQQPMGGWPTLQILPPSEWTSQRRPRQYPNDRLTEIPDGEEEWLRDHHQTHQREDSQRQQQQRQPIKNHEWANNEAQDK